MSLQREKFKLAYNRAKNKSDVNKELTNETRAVDPHDIEDWYADEMIPSMREIKWGMMLSFLKRLRIFSAKDLLDKWYW